MTTTEKRTDIPSLTNDTATPTLDKNLTLLGYALHHKHKNVLWIAPNHRAAQASFEQAKRYLQQSAKGSVAGIDSAARAIHLVNATNVTFTSLKGNADHLRGLRCDYVGYHKDFELNEGTEAIIKGVVMPLVVPGHGVVGKGHSVIEPLEMVTVKQEVKIEEDC